MFSSSKKRARADSGSDHFRVEDVPFGKRARATTEASADSGKWFNDSVLNTPTRTSARNPTDYDSDADTSSLRSEPGSPRDVSMDDDDVDMDDGTFSQSPEAAFLPRPNGPVPTHLPQKLQMNRVPTPMVPMRPGASPERIRTGFKQHVRRRHPQEYSASADLLEVPSPIDEDEVPTPPSAAEAAESRLSMLSVSDVDMDGNEGVPHISIDPARPNLTRPDGEADLESAIDSEPMDYGSNNLIVRKQRQRSGALSSGNPAVRATPIAGTNNKRGGFAMGFRPDCEKCRLRVPGHMNHFIV
ncbi:hypothetical protein CBER1_03829 [Cercospora berteroae]|uniref:Uncharacterized protein n=1 Tax=Cercospora berteroae TaxID=357750 RepID=A0A2S6CEB5_9PEZI|nr:hypothetical protein CBER1_03829 [Cercospora berteroae]